MLDSLVNVLKHVTMSHNLIIPTLCEVRTMLFPFHWKERILEIKRLIDKNCGAGINLTSFLYCFIIFSLHP